MTFSFDAAGHTAGGVAPRMNLAVDDSKVGWDVAASGSICSATLALPAGALALVAGLFVRRRRS